jgi:hypothetical protein
MQTSKHAPLEHFADEKFTRANAPIRCRCQFASLCELHPGAMGWFKRLLFYVDWLFSYRRGEVALRTPLLAIRLTRDSFDDDHRGCWLLLVLLLPARWSFTVEEGMSMYRFRWSRKLRKGITRKERLGDA